MPCTHTWRKAHETPETCLRRQGSHDEADRALAEIRKRYPEYRIPDATRARLERR